MFILNRPGRGYALFTGVRGIGILGSPHAGSCIAPVQRREAMPALTFAQRGTPTEGPPFPSRLVSKHMPPAKKTPIRGVGKDWSERYNFDVEPGLPLPPPRRPGFSLAPTHRSYATVFIMYRTGSKMD
jgi:hypothetical protein